MAIMTKEPELRPQHHSHSGHHMHLHSVRRHNVGGWERGARLFIGVAAMGAAFSVAPVWLGVVLGLVGASGIFTSVEGYCPINRAIRRDSYHHPLA